MYILRDYKAPRLSTKVNLNTGLSSELKGVETMLGFKTFEYFGP